MGVVVASGVAWIIEDRMTDLRLTQMVTGATDHIELNTMRSLTTADFQPPYTPGKLQALATRPRSLGHPRSGARHHSVVPGLPRRNGTVLRRG